MASEYWDRHWQRRLSRRTFVAGSATAVAGSAALLAGCGDDDDDDDGKTPSGGGQASPTKSTETPKRGGTLRWMKPDKDAGIDPQITFANNYEILPKVYSRTHIFALQTNQVQKEMALSIETPDPTTIRIKIRPDVKFQPHVANGRVLTSADLKYTFERFEPLRKQGSQVPGIAYQFMKSFATPDAQTLVITITPFASALAVMGTPAYGIVAKEMVEANGGRLDKVTAGAGPYKLTKQEADGTKLERWDGYFKHDPADPTFIKDGPYIDAIETRITADAASAKAAFLAGQIDLLNNTTVPVDKIVANELSKNSDIVVKEGDSLATYVFVFDNFKQWCTDKRLREAVSLAINREEIIGSVFAGDGVYGSPVSNGLKAWALPESELKKYQKQDPARAKALWKEGNGPSKLVLLDDANEEPQHSLSQILGEQLKKNLGVEIQQISVDVGTYVAKAVAPGIKEWDMFVAGASQYATLPDTNGYAMHDPRSYASLAGNFKLDDGPAESRRLAAELAKLHDAQSSELNVEARKKKMTEMQVWTLENFSPLIVLPSPKFARVAHHKRLRNFPYGEPGRYFLDVHNLWLAT